MSISRRNSYIENAVPRDEGRVAPLSSYWPSVFDPESQFAYAYDSVNRESVTDAVAKWDFEPSQEEFQAFRSQLVGQQLREYNAWQVVLPFDSQHQEAFLVVDGRYVRVWGRVESGRIASLLPAFQPIRSGFIASSNAFMSTVDGRPSGVTSRTDSRKPRTVEMVVCIQPGCVIHINNPLEILKIDAISKALAKSRDADFRWLQQSMFALQSNEERVKSLVRNLIGIKSTVEFDSERETFRHPISQNALAECLNMSDNTLRPYLKTANFEWASGKLIINTEFVEKVQAEFK